MGRISLEGTLGFSLWTDLTDYNAVLMTITLQSFLVVPVAFTQVGDFIEKFKLPYRSEVEIGLQHIQLHAN